MSDETLGSHAIATRRPADTIDLLSKNTEAAAPSDSASLDVI